MMTSETETEIMKLFDKAIRDDEQITAPINLILDNFAVSIEDAKFFARTFKNYYKLENLELMCDFCDNKADYIEINNEQDRLDSYYCDKCRNEVLSNNWKKISE